MIQSNKVNNVLHLLEKARATESDEATYRRYFYQQVMSAVLISTKRKILAANNALQAQFKMSEKELQKLLIDDILHPQDLQDDLKLFQRLVSGEIDQYDIIKRYHKPGEDSYWSGHIIVTRIDRRDTDPVIVCTFKEPHTIRGSIS